MRCREKDLRLVMDWPPEMARHILSDEGKLRQVLVNLLGNAVKFTDDGGITLRARITGIEDLMLEVEVEDSGCGIVPEEQGKIFDAFQQTVCGIQAQGGTGLGLAISKEYIRLLGGDISLDSKVGSGAIFRFIIPVDAAESRPSEAEELARARIIGLHSNQNQWRVLLVEDRDASRAFLSQILTLVGFQVIEAINGLEAVELAQSRQPHIVLMDLNMPVMDGYEATKRIKAANNRLPVIAVTASAFEEDRKKILDVGCDAFIRKPFKEHEIFDVIRDFVGVDYIYKEEKETDEKDAVAVSAPSTADCALLPDDLRSSMISAATTLEGDVLLELIGAMEEDFPELAASMKVMLDRYAFHDLARLLREENV